MTLLHAVQEQASIEEQARAACAAQLLMDCIADIVAHHGLKGPSYSALKSMTRGMVLEVEVAGAHPGDPTVFCSADNPRASSESGGSEHGVLPLPAVPPSMLPSL